MIFYKTVSAGNDFIHICRDEVADLTASQIVQLVQDLCQRKKGIGADGLIFYHRFIEISNNILKAGGWFLLEVGIGEHPILVKELFSNGNFGNVELVKDLNGDDRVLVAQLK